MPPNKLKEADVMVFPPDVRTPFRIKLPEVILFEPKFPNAGDEPMSKPTMNRPIRLRRFTSSSLPMFELSPSQVL